MVKTIIFVLLLVTPFVMAAQTQETTQLSEARIEDYAKFLYEGYSNNWTCEVCKVAQKTYTIDEGLIFTFWKPIVTALCKKVVQSHPITFDTCLDTAGRYMPGLRASYMRLFVLHDNYFCGYLLGVCPTSSFERIPFKPMIDDIMKGIPARKEPVPTLRATYKVLQFNDPHIDTFYTPGAAQNCNNNIVCCQAASSSGSATPNPAGYWGSTDTGSCDLPEHTFDAFVAFAQTNIKPDIVMWLGDNEYHEIDKITQSYNFQVTQLIAQKLKAGFPDSAIEFAIGNHENFPVDNLDLTKEDPELIKEDWFFKTFTSAYKGLLTPEQFKDFRYKGYYSSVHAKFNLRVINLLCSEMDTNNFYMFVDTYKPNGQLGWVRQQLELAEKNNEAVFITIHIPPGDGTFGLWDQLFSALVERFQNNIRGIFAGHTHKDELKWTKRRNDASKIVKTNFIGPSLTTFGQISPSFRVYTVDTDTGVILDYDQYRLDLAKWNQIGSAQPAQWDKVYSFKQQYSLPDLSTASMQTLYDSLFNMYQPQFNYYMTNRAPLNMNTFDPKFSQKIAAQPSPPFLRTTCGFNSESKELAKCMGFYLFTTYKSDLSSVFISNMYQTYLKINN
jgi:sphingomyelin phosphodiesterase